MMPRCQLAATFLSRRCADEKATLTTAAGYPADRFTDTGRLCPTSYLTDADTHAHCDSATPYGYAGGHAGARDDTDHGAAV
jgi:hypothetical protein